MKARPPSRPLPLQPVVDALARFVHDLRFDDIPDEVLAVARRSILDSLGIAVRAHQTPQAQLFLDEVTQWGGTPEATVIGTDRKLPSHCAGLIGGLLCHSFDFDDTHLPAIVHPSACVVPGALAASEEAGRNGKDFLTLAVIGYEVMARIGRAASGQFQIRGLHATSICGAIAVSALAARARGADERGIANAIGCAASMASGILEPAHDGTWTKLLQAGWAVHGGIIAARLGARGFLAPRRALEGEFGLYRALVDDDFDPAIVCAGLGSAWETLSISIKLYPTCHHLHSFLDACLGLVADPTVQVGEIAKIEAIVGEPQARIVCEPWAAKCTPETDYAARFSLPYAICAALIDGDVNLEQYSASRIGDSRIHDLIGKTTYCTEPNPDFPHRLGGALNVTFRDGRTISVRRENCRGTPEGGPITDADVRRKFLANARPVLGQTAARNIVECVSTLEVRTVTELLESVRVASQHEPMNGVGAVVE